MHGHHLTRRLKRFRTVFGKHPDEYRVVGVELDPQAFWEHCLKPKLDAEE